MQDGPILLGMRIYQDFYAYESGPHSGLARFSFSYHFSACFRHLQTNPEELESLYGWPRSDRCRP